MPGNKFRHQRRLPPARERCSRRPARRLPHVQRLRKVFQNQVGAAKPRELQVRHRQTLQVQSVFSSTASKFHFLKPFFPGVREGVDERRRLAQPHVEARRETHLHVPILRETVLEGRAAENTRSQPHQGEVISVQRT